MGHFSDFTDKDQCAYIEGVFDMLYEMGVRFVKNDYNRSVMYGAEMRGSCLQKDLKSTRKRSMHLLTESRQSTPTSILKTAEAAV